MVKDVTSVAAGNSQTRHAQADAFCQADPNGSVRSFRLAMGGANMGSTAAAHKIRVMDDAGAVLCARAVIGALDPSLDAAGIEQRFEELQVNVDEATGVETDWYPGRVAFERHWEFGESFVYWSLMTDGAGLAELDGERYGMFCLVTTDPDEPPADALAVFPGNSVRLYSMIGILDDATCEADATAWTDRAELLTCKHAEEVPSSEPESWAELICTDSDCSEVVRAGDFPLNALSEVRIQDAYLEKLEDWSAARLLGPGPGQEGLTSTEESDLEAYERLDRRRQLGEFRILGA